MDAKCFVIVVVSAGTSQSVNSTARRGSGAACGSTRHVAGTSFRREERGGGAVTQEQQNVYIKLIFHLR